MTKEQLDFINSANKINLFHFIGTNINILAPMCPEVRTGYI